MIKIKDKIIKHKKDIIQMLIMLIIFVILMIPVPYYISMGGGTILLDEKIEIANEYESIGSFSSTYVKEGRGRVITYLLSLIVPSYEREKIGKENTLEESEASYNKRQSLYFDNSLDEALIVAYKKAGKNIMYEENIYISFIDSKAKTNLELGDIIEKVNGVRINNTDEIIEIIQNSKENKVMITTRDNKEKEATIYEYKNRKVIGVVLEKSYKTEINDVKFTFSNDEQGPSAGLMIALEIYNSLIKEDITCGKKIAGTGTIDIDGNVGEIGGVKDKLIGAVENKADVFIVPSENYNEAQKIKNEKDLKIKIIGVTSFDEAIEKLKCQ